MALIGSSDGRLSRSGVSAGTATTIMGWVRSTSTTAALQTLFGMPESGPDGYICTNSTGTQFGWYIDFLFRGGFTFTSGVWYHYCHVRNGTSNTLYRNGASQATYTVTSDGATIEILGNSSGEFGSTIQVEDIKAWNRVLTVNEILAEMLAIRPIFSNGLIAWYPFLQGMSRTTDYSGNGRTLTEAGTITEGAGPPVAFGRAPYIHRADLFALEQEGFRFREDDGDEDAASWRAAQDTDAGALVGETVRLRTLINAASGNPGNRRFKLQHREVGASSWLDVE